MGCVVKKILKQRPRVIIETAGDVVNWVWVWNDDDESYHSLHNFDVIDWDDIPKGVGDHFMSINSIKRYKDTTFIP
jgi:hypothetical protein